jgi:hypothetical protein
MINNLVLTMCTSRVRANKPLVPTRTGEVPEHSTRNGAGAVARTIYVSPRRTIRIGTYAGYSC